MTQVHLLCKGGLIVTLCMLAILSPGCNRNVPSVWVEPSETEGVAPLTVQFTDESTVEKGEIEDWAWDFDDGASSTEQHPTHTFIRNGTYNVMLTVTTSRNKSAEGGATITVREPYISGEPAATKGGRVEKKDLVEDMTGLEGTNAPCEGEALPGAEEAHTGKTRGRGCSPAAADLPLAEMLKRLLGDWLLVGLSLMVLLAWRAQAH